MWGGVGLLQDQPNHSPPRTVFFFLRKDQKGNSRADIAQQRPVKSLIRELESAAAELTGLSGQKVVRGGVCVPCVSMHVCDHPKAQTLTLSVHLLDLVT